MRLMHRRRGVVAHQDVRKRGWNLSSDTESGLGSLLALLPFFQFLRALRDLRRMVQRGLYLCGAVSIFLVVLPICSAAAASAGKALDRHPSCCLDSLLSGALYSLSSANCCQLSFSCASSRSVSSRPFSLALAAGACCGRSRVPIFLGALFGGACRPTFFPGLSHR